MRVNINKTGIIDINRVSVYIMGEYVLISPLRYTFKSMSQKLDRLDDIMQNESKR